MNNKIAAAVMALLMSAGLAATARAAGDTMMDSAQTLVNGKPYVPGTALKKGDTLTFNGPGFVKINGVTIDFTGTTTNATYQNGVLNFTSATGDFTITDSKGKTTDVGATELHGSYLLEVSGTNSASVGAGRFSMEEEGVQMGTEMISGPVSLSPYDEQTLAIMNQFNGTVSPAQGVTLQVSPSAP